MKVLFHLFLVFVVSSALFSQKQQEQKEVLFTMKEVYEYYQVKNFDKTKEKLELWLSKSPESFPIDGFLILGNIYAHFKMFEPALKVYEKGLKLSENPFPYLVNMAQVYRQTGQHQKAVEILANLRNKATIYPEIYLFLGMSYFELRDRIQTIAAWESYLNLKPEGPKQDKVRKALAWMKQKDFKWPEELKKASEEEAEKLKKFIQDLKESINQEKMKELKQDPNLKEGQLEIQDKGKQEGESFDEIER